MDKDREVTTEQAVSSPRVRSFLTLHGWDQADTSPVEAGASTRRFTRLVRRADGAHAILMDTGGTDRPLPPTPYEQTIMPDFRPFAQVARILRKDLGMSAPEVYAASDDGHLLLVEDFGENEFIRLLQAGAPAAPLFALAVDTLLELQRRFARFKPEMTGLRHYTPDFFLSHLAVIPDVYMALLGGRAASPEARASFMQVWGDALTRACATPQSLMLRDFSISNSFHLPARPGVAAMGLIDFETAGTGPMIYDLSAILRNNRFSIPPGVVEDAKDRFRAGVHGLDADTFDAAYHIFTAMRQVQWAGSCALYTTQGRQGFLPNLPGIWDIVEDVSRHPALAAVRAWFDVHLPPDTRRPRQAA